MRTTLKLTVLHLIVFAAMIGLCGLVTIQRENAQWVAVTLASAAVLLITVSAIASDRIVGRPMRQLVAMSRRVAEGDFSQRLRLERRDEIGARAAAMDSLCERLEATRAALSRETTARITADHELRHSDRLAVVGRVAAGVAHEIGTPLNVIQGHADLIRDGAVEGVALRDSAEVIGRAVRRMAAVVGQLLDFARRREVDRHPHDLVSVVRRALGILEELARRSDVTVQVTGDMIVANVDGAQIEQVVTNLAMNAIHSMPQGGALRIDVGIGRRYAPDQQDELRDVVSIVVSDTGSGITDEHRQILFEPFFTTKAVGEGSGLGLPIVRGIVEEHGGWIECESEVGVGSTFIVCLPRTIAGT